MNKENTHMSRQRKVVFYLRRAFTFIAALYVVALTLYLAARFAWGDRFDWLGALNTIAIWLFAPLIVLFPLALLNRSKRLALTMLPLIAIGGIWVGRYYVPKAAVSPSGALLRVITYNAYGSEDKNLAESWLLGQDADILIMQEFPEELLDDGWTDLTGAYEHQFFHMAKGKDWGNLLLSRHPILTAENLEDISTDSVHTQQRVTIDWDGQEIAVYAVHFTPGLQQAEDGSYYYSDESRNTEIRLLLKLLREEALPYIVMGDFNMSDHNVIYGEIAAQMQDAFGKRGEGLGATYPVPSRLGFPAFLWPIARVDYVWYGDPFRAVSAALGPRLDSDHHPVQAVLELP